MTEKLLQSIDARFPLCESDIGELALVKAGALTFRIRSFTARGLGTVSLMRASGMLGMMKMATLIISPIYRDAPLYSYDSILALGKRTEIFELYDTQLEAYNDAELLRVKKSAEGLPAYAAGEHWYDSLKLPVSFALRSGRKHQAAFDAVTQSSVRAFIATVENASVCDPDKKRARASAYVEGLLEHGGPSTNVFKKAIGDEKAAVLFRRVLFGTAQAD